MSTQQPPGSAFRSKAAVQDLVQADLQTIKSARMVQAPRMARRRHNGQGEEDIPTPIKEVASTGRAPNNTAPATARVPNSLLDEEEETPPERSLEVDGKEDEVGLQPSRSAWENPVGAGGAMNPMPPAGTGAPTIRPRTGTGPRNIRFRERPSLLASARAIRSESKP